MEQTVNEKMTIKMLMHSLFAKVGKRALTVANDLGKTPSSLNGSIHHGRMNLGTFKELLEYCGEKLVIKLKNGQEIELEISDKKPKKDAGK